MTFSADPSAKGSGLLRSQVNLHAYPSSRPGPAASATRNTKRRAGSDRQHFTQLSAHLLAGRLSTGIPLERVFRFAQGIGFGRPLAAEDELSEHLGAQLRIEHRAVLQSRRPVNAPCRRRR